MTKILRGLISLTSLAVKLLEGLEPSYTPVSAQNNKNDVSLDNKYLLYETAISWNLPSGLSR